MLPPLGPPSLLGPFACELPSLLGLPTVGRLRLWAAFVCGLPPAVTTPTCGLPSPVGCPRPWAAPLRRSLYLPGCPYMGESRSWIRSTYSWSVI